MVSNYRRSQVEWSIAKTIDDTDQRSSGPSAALALDIKRLLDTDRRCEVTKQLPRSKALCLSSLELPGKGTEVEFSAEDAAVLRCGQIASGRVTSVNDCADGETDPPGYCARASSRWA